MEQKEFEQRLGLIKDVIKNTESLRDKLLLDIKSLPAASKDFLDVVSSRDNNFIKYLNLLRDFSFSDQLTTPSELFPGIRTAADTADPAELAQRAEAMKEIAGDIDVLQKKGSIESKTVSDTLKTCLKNFAEYSLQEAQIYELAIELLQDADSIYDIGQIAKNT